MARRKTHTSEPKSAKKIEKRVEKKMEKKAERKPDSGKLQAVNIAMQQIERDCGKGSIMKMGESLRNMPKVPVVSTGSLSLNLALGIGGYPRGRIGEGCGSGGA